MATHIYRFRSNGTPITDVKREVPGSPSLSASSRTFMDIQVDSANLTDLQDAMGTRGWTLVETDPTTTPAQALFTDINSALAVASASIDVNNQKITGLGTPTLSTDAATKGYADGLVSGTNTGDVTLTAVGSSPNANAASLSGQALTLQPASASFPGILTTGTQTIGGDKTLSGTTTLTNMVLVAQLITSASAAPISGTYAKGTVVLNSNPESGGNIGWVCITAGTPGTWKEFGLIST